MCGFISISTDSEFVNYSKHKQLFHFLNPSEEEACPLNVIQKHNCLTDITKLGLT